MRIVSYEINSRYFYCILRFVRIFGIISLRVIHDYWFHCVVLLYDIIFSGEPLCRFVRYPTFEIGNGESILKIIYVFG